MSCFSSAFSSFSLNSNKLVGFVEDEIYVLSAAVKIVKCVIKFLCIEGIDLFRMF